MRIGATGRLPFSSGSPESKTENRRTVLWLLSGITVLALSLRLLYLNADLWLDEIATVSQHARLSPLEVIGTYFNSNNHLLNTLLVKLAITCFGEQEWAVRLPAVIFGTATIPAAYWIARLALSRQASLSVALFLAVSYHHIFFSQNARGYSAYICFSLLSSGALIRGLQEDRLRIWVLYVVTMFFNFASLLISFFVFASHILVGGVALIVVSRRGFSPIPLLRRLTGVFLITAFLGFQLYALILPRAYVMAQTVYATTPAAGFSLFSLEFIKELIRGIFAGFGTGVILGVLPFLAIAGTGFSIVFRRQWALVVALAMPLLLTITWITINHLIVSPRFFLLALPLAFISAVQGIESFAQFIVRILGKSEDRFSPNFAALLVLVGCTISLVPLRHYYSVPKQAYRASIQYLEAERKPDEIVIVIHLAELGYRYYGQRFGLKEGEDYFFVRSVQALDAVLSAQSTKRSFLVTTFPRALRLSYPDLDARIAKNWQVLRTFPATIGDGEISVWKQR